MNKDIGIDLGTASVLVYVKGKGIVIKEPAVVAYDKDTNKIRAIGEEARQMIGRTPGNIVAIRPLKHGAISDFSVTEAMLKEIPPTLLKPSALTRMTAAMIRLRLLVKSTLFSTTLRTPIAEIIP